MPSDWKEPEKLADNFIVDSESQNTSHGEAAVPKDFEIPGLQRGTIFAGHYEIQSVLGQGGMSTVYKARHLLVDSVRAIKIIRLDQADNSKVLRRFQQEGKAALALEHPNIGRVYEFGIDATLQKPYLVMDYVDGKTLSATLLEEGALTTERACQLIGQVCEGLHEAHSKGVVHRDIKPGNIILTTDSTGAEMAKIVDFGIAKMIGRDDTQNLTQTGEVFGTPLYMSPEQCLGRKIDARSDIYSLGCVLYECLIGKPPYKGESSLETIMLHVNADESPDFKTTRIPPGLVSIVCKSLEVDAANRFQTMSDLQAAIQNVGSNNRTNVSMLDRLKLFQKTSRSGRKEKRLVAAFVLIGLIIGTCIVAFLGLTTHRYLWDRREVQQMKTKLIAEKRNDPLAWVGIAHELEQKGDLIDAERAYRKAIKLKPDYKPAWIGLANLLQKQGKKQDAQAALRHAADLN